MQWRSKVLQCCVATLAISPLLAGEAQMATGQRQLLEPPKKTVASPITDRFALRGLFMRTDINTSVRNDSSSGVTGTLISGEDTIGLPRRLNQGGAEMTFRMDTRHRIRADFYKMTRSGDRVIDQQIRFGDDIYQINDRVLSTMDMRKLGLAYSYSFLRTERFELGAGVGLHLLQFQGELQVPAQFQREKLDVAGPYPALTVDATWRMTHRFSLNLAGNYLQGHMEGVKGGYRSWHGDVQFRLRPNFALGLGYSQARFRINSETTDFVGYFNLGYKGPEAFLRVSF